MSPTVSIIVTAYLEKSKPYLDLCIQSINNLSYPRDRMKVLIVSPPSYVPKYDGCHNLHPTKPDYYNAHALNYGAEKAYGDYLFFVNDDVIFTKNSLSNLVSLSHDLNDPGIFMPISNDQQQRYILPIPFRPGPYRLKDIHDAQGMMDMESPYQQVKYSAILCDTLCLYAVIMSRDVFNKVGPFDDSRLGQDDIDFSMRVKRAGLLNVISLQSLVFHAGGVSADITMSEKQRSDSLESFNKKWQNF
jgi:GT2 family glycosyltransferase